MRLRRRGARARDDAAAVLGELERAVDQRLGLRLLHAPDVDAGELQRGLRLLILATGGAGLFERLLLELLGLGQAGRSSARRVHGGRAR